jgi:precorrin 3B synthase CobZ
MQRVCSGRSDPKLSEALIAESNEAIKWLASNGIRFELSFNRQAYEVDGKIKFWGGLCLKTPDGGKSLTADHMEAAARHGVETSFSTALTNIQRHPETGVIVTVAKDGKEQSIHASAVILAAGGFEANPRMRSQFLGPGWDMAKVRGTPYNTGDCINLALRNLGAQAVGNWSGCHSVAWDAAADADSGDREASNEYTKSGYPLGLMLNVEGRRFVDEGIDLRNYTYAKFGRAILAQPDHTAFQVWDSQTSNWLRSEEYREERVERITADTLEELAEKCAARGLQDKEAFTRTVEEYNDAVRAHRAEYPDMAWNPSVKDGLSTQSCTKRLQLAKSNWALTLDQAPFLAVKVTCGITFTFGGLKVDAETAQLVSNVDGKLIPGVYCVGEMMGGLFYQNYPGGSGLTSGTVFGRRAGRAAALTADK